MLTGANANPARIKRILREMARYSRDPHPHVEVFPSTTQLALWHMLLKGPEDTPYGNGVFRLYIEFGRDYPAEAPVVRFLTPIYHCNINNNGKVCHSVFDRNWTPDLSARQLIDCVYGLLLAPEPDDPLDSVLALQCLSSRAAYDASAAESTRANATSSTYQHMRQTLLHEADADSEAAPADAKASHPQHLTCPITMDLFDDPVTTKYGHTYERAAITSHLGRSSADPLTKQPLALNDIFPAFAIRDAVAQYKQATPWWDDDALPTLTPQ